jgi:protein gp37
MGADSPIEWCHHTINIWIGCTRVSPACDHCYAEKDWALGGLRGRVEWGPRGDRSPTKDPLAKFRALNAAAARRGRRERVFVNSLSDWADNHKSILPEWRDVIFEAARTCPNLDLLLLTKRPQNIRRYLPGDWGDGYPNVWLGTTAENQVEADRRIPDLLATPAAVRFVSAEPLLAGIRFDRIKTGYRRAQSSPDTLNALTGEELCGHGEYEGVFETSMTNRLDWIIVGGESGPGARPMHPDWARSIRDQCAAAGVAFFFKQWGEYVALEDAERLIPRAPGDVGARFDTMMIGGPPSKSRYTPMVRLGKRRAGRLLDGVEHNAMPQTAGADFHAHAATVSAKLRLDFANDPVMDPTHDDGGLT